VDRQECLPVQPAEYLAYQELQEALQAFRELQEKHQVYPEQLPVLLHTGRGALIPELQIRQAFQEAQLLPECRGPLNHPVRLAR